MKQMKVLLVDDEEAFVKTLSDRLNMRDLNSDTAFDGEQAIKYVDDQEPDVMILDLKMPGIDGLEVLKRVKKKYPKIQIIILTGHGSDKDEEESKKLGVYDYLKKPVDIETLVKSIKNAYQKKIEEAMITATFAEAGIYEPVKSYKH